MRIFDIRQHFGKISLLFLAFLMLVLTGCSDDPEQYQSKYFKKLPNMLHAHKGHASIALTSNEILITENVEYYLKPSFVPGHTKKLRSDEEIFDVKRQIFINPLSLYKSRKDMDKAIKAVLSNKRLDINSSDIFDDFNHELNRTDYVVSFLGNGLYLIVGGRHNSYVLSNAELRSLANQHFIKKMNLLKPRFKPTLVTLKDGRVLIVGGIPSDANTSWQDQDNIAEIFDPKNNSLSSTKPMHYARVGHTATLLNGGEVLIIGGEPGTITDKSSSSSNQAEIYSPKTNSFKVVGKTIYNHSWHTATLLANGKVLIVGGAGEQLYSGTPHVELFDPKANSFIDVSPSVHKRKKHSAIKLDNGQVLITGGMDLSNIDPGEYTTLKSSECFNLK